MFAYKLATEAPPLMMTARYIEPMRPHSPRQRRGWTGLRNRTALRRALLAAALIPGVASAALGEDVSTVERDRIQMRAQRAVTQSAGYAVHELQLPGGMQVREYLTSANKVFAVRWSGPGIPDLQLLLGTHFARYLAAAQASVQASGSPRRPLVVNDPDLVIHASGHMRAFFGVAYLPQLVPAGVDIGQLR